MVIFILQIIIALGTKKLNFEIRKGEKAKLHNVMNLNHVEKLSSFDKYNTNFAFLSERFMSVEYVNHFF